MKNSTKTVSVDLVRHFARLAKLPITDEEAKKYGLDLSSIMSQMQTIQELDLGDADETVRVSKEINVFRKDDVVESLPQEEVLKNSKKTHDGYFVVGRVL